MHERPKAVLSDGQVVTGVAAEVIDDLGGLTPEQEARFHDYQKIEKECFWPYEFRFVYMIQAETGAFKLGASERPVRRRKAIEGANPVAMTTVAAFEMGDDVFRAEAACHKHLTDRGVHLRREWFQGQAADYFQEVLEICRSFDGYKPLKQAVRISMELWPTYWAMLQDGEERSRAKASRREVVALVNELGLDWEF